MDISNRLVLEKQLTKKHIYITDNDAPLSEIYEFSMGIASLALQKMQESAKQKQEEKKAAESAPVAPCTSCEAAPEAPAQ